MKKQKLTKAEEEVMQLLWQHEPATVSQLLEHFEDKKPAHSTVSTIIRILEDKDFVGHEAYGRSYVYHSKVSQDEYSHFSLKETVMKYFQGSMENMISFLLREEKVDLEKLEDILEELKKEE